MYILLLRTQFQVHQVLHDATTDTTFANCTPNYTVVSLLKTLSACRREGFGVKKTSRKMSSINKLSVFGFFALFVVALAELDTEEALERINAIGVRYYNFHFLILTE